jgi:hypothetical protein
MDLAAHAHLTEDAGAEAKVRAIVHSLWEYRHDDGSFPHICPYSTDIHYTAWLSAELILIARMLPDAEIERLLAGTHAFLRQRVNASGETSYSDTLPTRLNPMIHYYSLGSGCVQDYDTRAWVNELGYMAMVLERAEDDRYHDVMAFLGNLERNGTFPDKWAFMPDPESPLHFWASAEESVIRTSMIFWMLAAIQAGRPGAAPAGGDMTATAGGDATATAGGDAAASLQATAPIPPAPALTALPNPFAGSTVLGYEIAAGPARITVCNARGEVVRELLAGVFPAGRRTTVWDGRAEDGAALPAGVYFARLEVPGLNLATKLVRLE